MEKKRFGSFLFLECSYLICSRKPYLKFLKMKKMGERRLPFTYVFNLYSISCMTSTLRMQKKMPRVCRIFFIPRKALIRMYYKISVTRPSLSFSSQQTTEHNIQNEIRKLHLTWKLTDVLKAKSNTSQ